MLLPWVPVNPESCSRVSGPLSEKQACTELNLQFYTLCSAPPAGALSVTSLQGPRGEVQEQGQASTASSCNALSHRTQLRAEKGRSTCQITVCYKDKALQSRMGRWPRRIRGQNTKRNSSYVSHRHQITVWDDLIVYTCQLTVYTCCLLANTSGCEVNQISLQRLA